MAVLWPRRQTARPWQFWWRFSAPWASWSTNCRPWQFWWHFSARTQPNFMGGSQTATLGSFDGTKLLLLKLKTLAVLMTLFSKVGHQTANLGSFNGTFQQRSNVSIKLPTSDSFDGAKLSSLYLQTLAVSMALFSRVTLLVNKLQNLAVLKWTICCRQDFVRGQILVQDGRQLGRVQKLN